jgi:hypothetical protein
MTLYPCPFCGKLNQSFVTFCINCGEPFEDDSPGDSRFAPRGLPREQRTIARAGHLVTHKLEFLLGLAILLSLAGYAFYSNQRDSALAAHYRTALTAMAHQDYSRALVELQAAGDYRDAIKQIQALNETIKLRDNLYSRAQASFRKGAWTDAAADLRQVVNIQSDYKDALQLLRKARSFNGIVLNRTPDGALRISEADGGEVRVVPGTNARTYVLAVSSDSEWLLYTGDGPGGPELRLYSVTAAIARAVTFPGSESISEVTARFLPSAQSLWVEAGGSIYFFKLPFPYDGQPIAPDRAETDSVSGTLDSTTMR